MEDNTNHSGRLSRRRFLSMTAMGTSAWGLTGTVGASSGDTTEISVARSGSEVVETAEVPQAWVAHLQQARQAKEQVARQIRRDHGTAESAPDQDGARTAIDATVSLEPGDQRYGNLSGFRVHVRSPDPAVRDDVPAEANGIPVRVEEIDDMGYSDCPNRGYYDPLPGGVALYRGDSGSLYRAGSATTAVTKENTTSTYLLTAAHVVGDFDPNTGTCTASTGTDVYIDDDWLDKIGDVVGYDIEQDYALIKDTTGEVDFANAVREESDYSVDYLGVDGHLDENGVAYWMSNDKEVRKTGSSTGLTTGQITEMYVTGYKCTNLEDHGVTSDTFCAEGDSGSPVYAEIGGDAYMVHMLQQLPENTGTNDCGGGESGSTIGAAAYRMNETGNIVFDV